MEVARTSMIHAAAPHFLWQFAVRYATHQLNLLPRVSFPENLPTLRWTGVVGDASVFRFYHPTSRRVIPSHDITFDDCRLWAAYGGAASGGAEPGGAESEGAGSGGAEPGGAEPRGAEPAGVEPGGTEPEGVEPGGAESEGAESGGAEPRGNASSGGAAGASPRLSPWPEPLSLQHLREWFAQRIRLRSGAARAGDFAAGDTGAGGAGVTAGAGGARTRGNGAAGTGGVGGAGAGDPTEHGSAGDGGVGDGGTGAGGAGAGGAGAVDLGARGAGAGGVVSGATGSQPLLQPASPLPAPSPYSEQTGGLTECRELAFRPASPVCTGRRVPRLCPPPVPGTHAMALRPSSVPLRVPLPPLPESSLPTIPDPESDRARAASPTLVEFAAACRLDYATALVAESASASPPSVGGECALGTGVLEDRQEELECIAVAVPRFASMLLAPEGDLMHQTTRPRALTDTGSTTALGFTPSIADPSLFLRSDTLLPPFYVLVYVDDLVFAIADTEALTLVKSELQKRHTYTGLQITWDRARRTITLTHSHLS
ncbi:unnamed protein product [Closterium sp. NIES-53]